MRRLILITDPSTEFGSQLAIKTSQLFSNNTHFLLMTKHNIETLQSIKDTILNNANLNDDNSPNKVSIVEVDFTQSHDVAYYSNILKVSLLQQEDSCLSFDELIAVYSHGSIEIGCVALVAQNNLRQNFELNLFSIW